MDGWRKEEREGGEKKGREEGKTQVGSAQTASWSSD